MSSLFSSFFFFFFPKMLAVCSICKREGFEKVGLKMLLGCGKCGYVLLG